MARLIGQSPGNEAKFMPRDREVGDRDDGHQTKRDPRIGGDGGQPRKRSMLAHRQVLAPLPDPEAGPKAGNGRTPVHWWSAPRFSAACHPAHVMDSPASRADPRASGGYRTLPASPS